MRHEIKIPFKNDFDSYYLNWKDFRNKFNKLYDPHYDLRMTLPLLPLIISFNLMIILIS